MNMRKITEQELKEILEKHEKWLNGEEGGSRADLSYANLTNVNLTNANLYRANLYNASLYRANLTNVNLTNANLYNANLYNANLSNANLEDANLSYASLSNANLDKSEQCRFGIILQEPRMGYKKCGKYIVQLLIPKGAIVFSINNKNCRTNKATPIAILDLDGKITSRKKIASDYDETFEYKLMEEIEIQDFNLMYNVECTTGIHFFWDFESAKNY